MWDTAGWLSPRPRRQAELHTEQGCVSSRLQRLNYQCEFGGPGPCRAGQTRVLLQTGAASSVLFTLSALFGGDGLSLGQPRVWPVPWFWRERLERRLHRELRRAFVLREGNVKPSDLSKLERSQWSLKTVIDKSKAAAYHPSCCAGTRHSRGVTLYKEGPCAELPFSPTWYISCILCSPFSSSLFCTLTEPFCQSINTRSLYD